MITQKEYFGEWFSHKDVTPEVLVNADKLLVACAMLEKLAILDGLIFPKNPSTGSGVSGSRYGGFRPKDCTVGAAKSSHKTGEGVDLYDPDGKIDDWCKAHPDKLEVCGIYLEEPAVTRGWSHWTIRAPRSGNRVFLP